VILLEDLEVVLEPHSEAVQGITRGGGRKPAKAMIPTKLGDPTDGGS
jgi:hypothetical protein